MTKQNLDEISFLRPILIIMLVAFHSFNPWCHGWPAFAGFEENDVFYWLGKIAYSFMLPLFVFMSAYIWSFQIHALKREYTFKKIAVGKFKRLMIPCIVFSALYFLYYLTQQGFHYYIVQPI